MPVAASSGCEILADVPHELEALYSVSRFLGWCIESPELSKNPLAKVRPPTVPEKPVPLLTADEV